MYLNKRQIKQAYNGGHIDTVAKQLRMYGVIQQDKAWDEQVGHYAGAHRVMRILHHGLEWKIHMHNGEVTQLGYTITH